VSLFTIVVVFLFQFFVLPHLARGGGSGQNNFTIAVGLVS
jgi:hypothetical protein